ncbi:hypothetical protein V6N11_033989 [Hibiscus sabdariffa]|uniref:Uncharacterized protein n=1 Tax=Hibiscus sabdariffa TaxID=183260 RepID=A0ABR2S1B4_9ROSI
MDANSLWMWVIVAKHGATTLSWRVQDQRLSSMFVIWRNIVMVNNEYASGLQIKFKKSLLYGTGVVAFVVQEMVLELGCVKWSCFFAMEANSLWMWVNVAKYGATTLSWKVQDQRLSSMFVIWRNIVLVNHEVIVHHFKGVE